MKKQLILFLLFLPVLMEAQTFYYLSNLGDDTNNGISPATPWKTIAKLNTVTLYPGDVVSFRSGDTFRGQINVNQSGTAASRIVFTYYGTGVKPIIKASEILTGWVQNGNIWACKATSNVRNVFVNGVQMTKARSPNSGYYGGWTISTTNDSTTITSDSLTQPDNYWNNGTLHVRPSDYYSDTGYVTSYISGILNFSPIRPMAGVGYSFYIDNVKSALDTAGEWFCDFTTDSVYLMAPGGANPNTLTIEGTTYDYGIYSTKGFITVDGLDIRHQQKAGICFTGNNRDITVQNCNVADGIGTGILLTCNSQTQKIAHCLIISNTVTDWNSDGICLELPDSSTISNNTIRNIFMVYGYGDGWSFPILILDNPSYARSGVKNIISGNTIDSAGYSGIYIDGNNNIIEYNLISNVMLLYSDGGGIYCYGEARVGIAPNYTYGTYNNVFRRNIVKNCKGSRVGTPNSIYGGYSNALYNDGYSFRNNWDTNTVYNNDNVGLFIQYGDDSVKVLDNMFYKNGRAEPGKAIYWEQDTTKPAGAPHWDHHTFKYNTIWTLTNDYQFYYQINRGGASQNSTAHFGIMDSNYWCAPWGKSNYFLIQYINDPDPRTLEWFSLAQWKIRTGQDTHSKDIYASWDSTKTDSLFVNETNYIVQYLIDTNYRDVDGNPVPPPLILQPFTSKLLFFDPWTPSSINEFSKEKIFIVYPNPTNDNLTIDVSTTLNIPATIEITNIQGQVIEQQPTNVETTNFVVSALAKGMYFIKVKTEKGVESRKFVKL